MRKTTTPSSGTSKPPRLLPYPELVPFGHGELVKDLFCYLVRYYSDDGLSLLLKRFPASDEVTAVCGNWAGELLDPRDESSKYYTNLRELLASLLPKILNLLRLIRLEQCQCFFAATPDLVLVDVQVSLNKFLGPGMLKDLFGRLITTQEVLKMETLDTRAIEAIERGTGSYGWPLLVKPSRFRTTMYNNNMVPLYAVIGR